MSFITQIQKKSPEKRKRILVTILILSAILLLLAWILTLPLTARAPKDTTLFDALSRGFAESSARLKN